MQMRQTGHAGIVCDSAAPRPRSTIGTSAGLVVLLGAVGRLLIGLASGVICWWASTTVKRRFRYDDSLDVFVLVSLALLEAVDAAIGLRVSGEEESGGLDLALHDEVGYNL